MEQQYYVLEQLSQAKRTLLQVCTELPQIREKMEQQLKFDRKKAKDWFEYLSSNHKKILGSLEICRLSLLELEQEQLANTTLRLYQSVEQFNLMTPDYSKLIDVVQNYLSRLPNQQDIKTNSAIIGRLMNNVRIGYYPTDLEHIKKLAEAITFPDDSKVNLFDPCCGCGLALHQLGFDKNCTTYGAEIDESRAQEAQGRLDRVAFGSFFHSRISRESFHAMLLNPPYLSVLTQTGSKARYEKRFLVESLDHLMLGGLLLYIIPYYRLTEDIARILCDNFADLSVYKFMGKEFERFKQIVILGTKQKRIDGSTLVRELLNKVTITEEIPNLYELSKGRYILPMQEREVQIFKGAVFNVAELARQLEKSDSFSKLLKQSVLDNKEKRPLLPLKAGQVGLIGGSGMINGLAECDNPHVIKGRIIKELIVDQTDLQVDKQNRVTCTERTETQTNRLVFNILTIDGFKSLTQ